MRSALFACCLIVAAGLPKVGNAQVSYRPTPAPVVTAASATWQINGEPLFFAGSFYYPTGPVVFFDGQLMARVGEYLTVPLYADTTFEAYSRVFVPIGGAMMKPYDRRRAGPLAGTVGSTTPSWPVQVATNEPGTASEIAEAPVARDVVRPVATSGVATSCDCPVATAGPVAVGTIGSITSAPPPLRNTGISIRFQGSEYFSAGRTVPYTPKQFERIGDHHGFPVFRDQQGDTETIYVTVVADGPLARYRRKD
jgi:hypothetical protein